MVAGLSQILSGLALAGFAGVALWLLMRPRERMAALMPAPRLLVATAAATTLWCAAVAVFAPGSSQSLVVQPLRDLAMLGWLGATFWSSRGPMSRPLRLILKMLATICVLTLLLGTAAHLRAGAAAEPWMAPTLTFAAMLVAVGGLLIIDGGVRHASAGQRMPVMAVAGGFAMLWAYELNVRLIGALTGNPASTLILLIPAAAAFLIDLFCKNDRKSGNVKYSAAWRIWGCVPWWEQTQDADIPFLTKPGWRWSCYAAGAPLRRKR